MTSTCRIRTCSLGSSSKITKCGAVYSFACTPYIYILFSDRLCYPGYFHTFYGALYYTRRARRARRENRDAEKIMLYGTSNCLSIKDDSHEVPYVPLIVITAHRTRSSVITLRRQQPRRAVPMKLRSKRTSARRARGERAALPTPHGPHPSCASCAPGAVPWRPWRPCGGCAGPCAASPRASPPPSHW